MKGDRKNQERNIVTFKNQTYNHTCEEYIQTEHLGPVSRKILLNLIQSIVLVLVN